MSNRTINLFMDRADKADDNAEALYDYFVKYGDKKDKNYFILLKGSTDYSRLQKKGYNLVPYGSTKHRLLLLTADNLISSSGDQECYHPFSETNRVYNDVKSYKYAFLTHGILQGDISHWLRKSVKDFRIFVTANKEEYKTVITGNFQFTEREVKLTGLPRYDKLISADNPKNIMLMPTWRYDIVSPVDKETNLRPYNETFKESSYYKTWNSILNNERLLDCAKKAGYRIQFVPHPSIRQQLKDFDLANVDVVNETDLYSELFKNGSLLVTDYSSVHFDFAYMKKPVAYYHFDSGNYPYEFSYEDTGFGPVLKDKEALIDYILGGIEEKFEMGHKYIQRVDEFFVYKDKNNCERLYNEIKNLK